MAASAFAPITRRSEGAAPSTCTPAATETLVWQAMPCPTGATVASSVTAHLRNMLQAAQDGYVILPPVLTFYNGCETTMDQVDHVIGKILMQFDIEYDRFHPWEG